MKLYHATFGVNKDSILKNGLLLPNGKSNWIDAYAGEYIYLATDKFVAESYVECTDNKNIPNEYFEDIIVLEVNLPMNELMVDPNNLNGDTYVYNKNIPPNKLKLANLEN